ncbi:SURF1 family protein [Altererythrobacter sp. MF3-039]|uniref:SURF1 family protein n=1 Tax=Altererythrobacter sp. MF3-039 TaxID=3252901 RepID=UPI00390C5193
MPRIPIIPTIVVAAAVATMIALGIWQLGRAEEKEALIARAEQSLAMSSDVQWPKGEAEVESALYRHTRLVCASVAAIDARGGRSREGETGWLHSAQCTTKDGDLITVVLGWSRRPVPVSYDGGEVMGIIAPGPRIVASPPVAGLKDAALPDPRDLPNNHLAYAGQWFFFALTALVIYVLALRRRRRTSQG